MHYEPSKSGRRQRYVSKPPVPSSRGALAFRTGEGIPETAEVKAGRPEPVSLPPIRCHRHVSKDPRLADRDKIAFRVAIQLGREQRGLFRTYDEITADAYALADAGLAAHQAIAVGASPEPAYKDAQNVALLYDAIVVRHRPKGDETLGIKHRDVFLGLMLSDGTGHPGMFKVV